MKHLSDYVEENQTKAFRKADAFFAFSDAQFEEGTKEGIKYISLGGGLIANREKAEQLIKELDQIHKNGITQDIKENGKKNIIIRELANHEAYYTGDIESIKDALQDYDIKDAEILAVYKVEALKNTDY